MYKETEKGKLPTKLSILDVFILLFNVQLTLLTMLQSIYHTNMVTDSY